jgi:hypothetical protein
MLAKIPKMSRPFYGSQGDQDCPMTPNTTVAIRRPLGSLAGSISMNAAASRIKCDYPSMHFRTPSKNSRRCEGGFLLPEKYLRPDRRALLERACKPSRNNFLESPKQSGGYLQHSLTGSKIPEKLFAQG